MANYHSERKGIITKSPEQSDTHIPAVYKTTCFSYPCWPLTLLDSIFTYECEMTSYCHIHKERFLRYNSKKLTTYIFINKIMKK